MNTPAPNDRSLFAPLVAIAAVGLGYAIQVSNGNLHPQSVTWLTVAVVTSTLALVLPTLRREDATRQAERLAVLVLGAGLIWQFAQLCTTSPAMYLRPGREGFQPFLMGIAAAAVLAGAGLGSDSWLGRWRLPLLVGVHLALGYWILRASPRPHIDVFAWHVEALQALGRGVNPYAITMPDIYGHDLFYEPGLLANGRVQVGFTYPPLSLLIAGIGYVLGGDYRWANLVAMGLAAVLMGQCQPGRLPAVAAAVFLFTPRTFFVLEQGWTEAHIAFLMALTVWSACRAPRVLPVALGLLFASKHYLILAAPLVVLLHPGPSPWRATVRTVLKAVAVAAVITLPFAVLDPVAFYQDMITFQLRQPFRVESLSYLAWWNQHMGVRPPPLLGFVAVLPVIGLALWRAPRTPAGFALAVGLLIMIFFAFSKQAFCNYYYFIVAALCCALAAWNAPVRSLATRTPAPATPPTAT
ncbi:hypothetical protein D187_008862 [Cystobacter fuscus DSM 2262]|uniref:DUF2029 domain-containing protein n=1 Tax=Cystobacter fuscus (strain ATCC 25194 / DSM 2262 / NBRC 100088 / M29) TaxID=1242864 RepID=S9QN34_CYSF2|nr:hypothetical protein [Cystobacter fuscus]EPX62674.1 hypothetical protein D187_008862 [Cystobacter fuscus DSM 2262]